MCGHSLKKTLGKIIVGIFELAVAKIAETFFKLDVLWQQFKDMFTDNADGIAAAQDKVAKSSAAVDAANAKIKEGVDNVVQVYNDAKVALGAYIKEQEREIAIAKMLADKQANLDKAVRKQLTTEAEQRLKIAKLRNDVADKDNVSAQERLKLLEEAQKIEKAITEENLRILKAKADLKNRAKRTKQFNKRRSGRGSKIARSSFRSAGTIL